MHTTILTLANWLHMLATVIWIGGMIIFPFVLVPAARQVLGEGPAMGKLMGAAAKRFAPLAILSMVVLLVTGMVMMMASSGYSGMGDIQGRWATVMLLKHVLVLVMMAIGIYMGAVIMKKMQKLAGTGEGPPSDPQALAKLQALQMKLAKINLVLALVVLLLTGYAGVVSG